MLLLVLLLQHDPFNATGSTLSKGNGMQLANLGSNWQFLDGFIYWEHEDQVFLAMYLGNNPVHVYQLVALSTFSGAYTDALSRLALDETLQPRTHYCAQRRPPSVQR